MQLERLSAGVLVSVLALSGASAAPALGVAGAADGWGPTVDVSPPAPDIFDNEVVIDARGRTLAAWVRGEADGKPSAVFMASRTKEGPWGDPARVVGTFAASEVELGVAGDGEIVLAWTSGRTVKAARKAPGSAWSGPVSVHRTASGVRGVMPAELHLAVNGRGRAGLAWTTRDDDMDGVYALSRSQAAVGAADGRWTGTRTLSTPNKSAAQPEVSVGPGGRVIVVWDEHTYGWNSRVMVASREPGAAWAAPRALSRRSLGAGVPQIGQNAAGDVAVAWSFSIGTTWGVRLRRWREGSGWSRQTTVPGVLGRVYWVDLGLDSTGTPTLAWTNKAGTVWSAEQSRRGEWSTTKVAPARSQFYGLTLVVNEAGDAVVGWESVDGGHHPVMAAYRHRNGGWEQPTFLSARRGDSFGPSLALDWNGDAAAVWTYARGTWSSSRVQARGFTAR